MRRITAAVATTAIAALTLAGCATGPEGGAGADSGEVSGEVTYAFWDENQRAVIEEMVAAFEEEHPDVDVTLSVLPWSQYWTTLQTQASSDSLPDVFWMNMPNFRLYASNGQLAPIDEEAIDVDAYPASLAEFFVEDGERYAVPKDADTTAVWINKALFADAGVDLPAADWTWEDYRETAAAITAALGDQGVYGSGYYPYGQSMYYNTVYQAGGFVISEDGTASGWDEPEAQAGLQFWVDLIEDGSTPTVGQLTETSGDQWFMSNKIAMYPQVAGSTVAAFGQAPDAADYTVVPLPQDAEQVSIGHSLSNVVAAKSSNLAAAQALQSFLAGEEAQRIQSESGVALSAYAGTEEAFVASYPEFDLQVFVDAIDYAVPYPSSRNTAAWAGAESDILAQVWGGTLSVEDATAELAAQMNEALAKE